MGAVVADPSDPDLAVDLAAAQAAMRSELSIDGPYLAWSDLVVPPIGVQPPCVRENLQTYWAGRRSCRTLRGDSAQLLDAVAFTQAVVEHVSTGV